MKRTDLLRWGMILALLIMCFSCPEPSQPPPACVIYSGNGSTAGSAPVDAVQYSSGDTVTVLGNAGNLLKINVGGVSFRFDGWNTEADGSGTSYAPTDTFTYASTITLYAMWTPYALRDTGPAGGLIFYDQGLYANGWRYMELAPSSTATFGVQWGAMDKNITGTSDSIGSGKENTDIIVAWLAANGETGRAAQLADALVYAGFNDWYLPSMEEIHQMYDNLAVYGQGNFNGTYWSSSEINTAFAHACGLLIDWSVYAKQKDGDANSRAARRF